MSQFSSRELEADNITFLKAFMAAHILMFIISLVYSGKNIGLTLNPLFALQPSEKVLEFLGAGGRLPILKYQTWWPLVTAGWLHGGILHIVFNMLALWTVGPLAVKEYGPYRMFCIFTLSSIIGFFISFHGNTALLTIGASSGLCGLIGALWYFGRSAGGDWAFAVFRQTSGWLISLGLFGMFLPNIDNWGHAGGFVGGVFFAWLLKYKGKRSQNRFDISMAALLGLITAWHLLKSIIQGFSLIFL